MSELKEQRSRREILSVGATCAAAVAGLGALSACSGGGSTSATSGATTGDGAAAASGSANDSTATAVAQLNDVPLGSAVIRDVKGIPVVISRTGDSQVVGFDARCTHQGCPVQIQNTGLVCPCHGSRFNIATGAVEQGPADAPLAPFALAVSGETITAS